MDHHLLAVEGRIEVRDDANLPRVAEPECLRRGAIFAPGVEGTALELVFRRRLELGQPGARAVAASRSDDDLPAGERVCPEVGQL
jgi:uncharacterized protein YjhX (UPF0386 family)